MNKPFTIIAFLLAGVITSCTKEDTTGSVLVPQPLPEPAPVTDDRAVILVKDILEQGMPSPYFHFNYDSGYVNNISFADGFFDYDVSYQNKRVAFMVNKKNSARLDYVYSNGKVSDIRQSLAGKMNWTYKMFYDQNKLLQVQWYRFESTGDSTLERKIELFYGGDGNLTSYKDYWRNGGNELKLSRTFLFSNYDGGRNVDDFYLFKNFFEDLIFLPGIKLQKNNPGLVKIIGEQNDFEVRYTYTYRNGLPLQKQGIFKQTRGGTGPETSLLTTYSYY